MYCKDLQVFFLSDYIQFVFIVFQLCVGEFYKEWYIEE